MLNLLNIRKELHQIPELAFQEYETQNYILKQLAACQNIRIHQFKPTGLLVEYKPGSGKFLLFRADMDALPITENTGCDFASKHQGIMHACGHDLHMTILLGLIDRVLSEGIKQNLLFLFQPAEEGRSGAEAVLKDPVWEKYQIDSVYALHVSPELLPGVISSRAGNFFAATCEYDILIKGVSAHIATPEKGKSALQAGIEIYQSVQQLPRMIKSEEKFICGFGKMTAGAVRNAIPADCLLSGTIRADSQTAIAYIKEALEAICHTVATAYEVKIDLEYLAEYKEVYNDKELVEDLQNAARELAIDYQQAPKTMAGEDFGFFTDRWQGLLFWLGARQNEFFPLHSDKFLPSSDCLEAGVNLFYQIIKNKTGT
jgi:N-acetyldiaminopimelate deacetylase